MNIETKVIITIACIDAFIILLFNINRKKPKDNKTIY
jgi:hypothetical protein